MTLSELERAILADAHEDAYSLHEIVAGLRVRLPGKTEAELREIAASAITSLLTQGFVYLCRFDPKTNEESDISSVAKDELRINGPEWEAQEYLGSYISILPTQEGGRVLFGDRPPADNL